MPSGGTSARRHQKSVVALILENAVEREAGFAVL